MLDLVIRNGRVVDGTGAPARPGDVGIEGDRVVAIGGDIPEGAHEIDAAGQVVAPGFVDVHTHYDAQAFWDGALTPSPLHGITTVLAGNCGFTIAPLPEAVDEGDYLMRLLARVEGMPLEALQVGVPWSWRTTGEYLDLLEGTLGVNAGFMVGHSALRRVVMGRAAVQREATEDEVAQMVVLLHEGIDAGGLGFSSSWSRTHNDADGHMVPSRYAHRDELVALATAIGDHEGTSIEFLPMVGRFEDWTYELMTDMSVAAGRPLNWNVLGITAKSLADAEHQLQAGDHAAARGGKVVALTVPVNPQLRLSFRSGFALDAIPGWEEVMLLPVDAKLDVFRDPDARDALNVQAQRRDNPMRHFAHWERLQILDAVAPENQEYVGMSVGEAAERKGLSAWDTLCEIAVADELNTGFALVPRADTVDDWRARAQVWRDRRAVVGGSDAGAHLDMFTTANIVTHMLGAVRDFDLMSIEEAVHLVTQVPAELYGLRDRGVLTEQAKADVVVFDPATVNTRPVEMRYDLPAGAGRLVADAEGIDHVIVNGTPIVRDGRLLEARPGTVLRSGRDTANASMK
jgi:N-acyl-D-aspartate/D-glutamate deacylase